MMMLKMMAAMVVLVLEPLLPLVAVVDDASGAIDF